MNRTLGLGAGGVWACSFNKEKKSSKSGNNRSIGRSVEKSVESVFETSFEFTDYPWELLNKSSPSEVFYIQIDLLINVMHNQLMINY
jgi:hypothetical protein